MKKAWTLAALSLALAAAYPAAHAAPNDDILAELKALKAKVNELEQKLQAQDAKIADMPQGMTPEQQADFNRIAVKTEALEDGRDSLGFKGLKISGYMDPTYIYNQRRDRAGFQFLNNVSEGDSYNYSYDNSYFGAAVIDFLKETDGGTRWHFALAPNRGVGATFNGNSPIQEASVSVPLTDLQTRLIAGQIPDWSGYEYLQAPLNKLISHNLLFDFTLPTAYTGAGLELTRDQWIIKGVLANVNTSKRADGRTAPAFAYRVDYAKGEFQGFGFAGVHGQAANGTTLVADGAPDSRIDLFEADGYFIRGDWTVQGQISFGRQKDAAIALSSTGALQDAQWWGLSGLAAYKFNPRFEGTVRADYLNNSKHGGGLLGYATADDINGIGPDALVCPDTGVVDSGCSKGANRAALTFGLSYLWDLNTTFKVEYRYDWASKSVFLDTGSGDYKKSNQLLGASVVVTF
ncbi:DUF3138 family protein [Aquabacterium sp.]|uniref:DUF3138 family protein n=1 Tax=Aquabacterium sp. TaxID=1872578 RepID=UPI0035B130BF